MGRNEILYDLMLRTFITAAKRRDERPDVEERDGERAPGWVFAERDYLLSAVNRERRRRSLPEVRYGDVADIERGAAGHVDYAHKLALRCSFLAEGLDARSREVG